jgi:hypothetical protein
MTVTVVDVWPMGMGVFQGRMLVRMGVGFISRIKWPMFMLMMLIMDMAVIMGKGIVDMLMAVPLRQVQPRTQRH